MSTRMKAQPGFVEADGSTHIERCGRPRHSKGRFTLFLTTGLSGILSGVQESPQTNRWARRLLVIMCIVSFLLEVTGVRRSFNFGTHASRVFLNDSQFLVLTDKA